MRYQQQLIAALLLCCCPLLAVGSTHEQHPNVVLILVDDMGFGDPQSYVPESKIPTPNIDRLAAQGMSFTDAHSASSVCTPTRYSMLTGRYAWRSRLKRGVLGPYNKPLIEADRLTLPKMLKEKGYDTALVGKWHLGMQWVTKNGEELPERMDWKSWTFRSSAIDHSRPMTAGPMTAGFDYYFGVDVPNFPPYAFIENAQVIGIPSGKKPSNMYGEKGPMVPGWKLEEILPTLTAKAVEYIDTRVAENSGKPFFLHMSTTSPHTPIVPAEEFIGQSGAGPYGDLVHQTDHTVGEIIKALERNKLLENTIVIFTSDNGSPSRAGDPHVHGRDFHPPGSVITKFGHNPNAPWRGMKADIYEGGHRVPFVVWWPGKTPENVSSRELISSVDIMATLAAIVGYALPTNSAEDSYDLSALFRGEMVGIDAEKEPIREAIVHHSSKGKFAIRQGRWKMIPQAGSGGWKDAPSGWLSKVSRNLKKLVNGTYNEVEPEGQLYDLVADPAETENLWNEHPEVVERLERLLERYQQEGRSVSMSGPVGLSTTRTNQGAPGPRSTIPEE